MKKIIALSGIVLLTKMGLGQTSFSECYDTLHWRTTHDTISFYDKIVDWQNCIKGKQMPYLSLTTISGEKIETQKLKGKVLIINLWFTSCHPCIAELPALNRLVNEYKGRDAVFLGLSTDTKQILDSYFFPNYKFDFTIVADAKDAVRQIGLTGFPTTYIIDKKGNVRDAWNGGPINDKAKTEAYLRAKPIIDELLAERN
jgi:peroxiredoxin